jgi:hypothetical protein
MVVGIGFRPYDYRIAVKKGMGDVVIASRVTSLIKQFCGQLSLWMGFDSLAIIE